MMRSMRKQLQFSATVEEERKRDEDEELLSANSSGLVSECRSRVRGCNEMHARDRSCGRSLTGCLLLVAGLTIETRTPARARFRVIDEILHVLRSVE